MCYLGTNVKSLGKLGNCSVMIQENIVMSGKFSKYLVSKVLDIITHDPSRLCLRG